MMETLAYWLAGAGVIVFITGVVDMKKGGKDFDWFLSLSKYLILCAILCAMLSFK